MRILLLAHRYPPYPGVGALRWGDLSRQLVKRGLEVEVLTAAWPGRTGVCGEQMAGLRIHRLARKYPLFAESMYVRSGASRMLAGAARRVLKWTTHRRDSAEWWSHGAEAKALKLHAREPVDCIVATGPPFTTVVAAARIQEATGLPLIIDYRDLWSDDPSVRWAGSASEEQAALVRAAAVIVTSDPMARTLKQYVSSQRIEVILNGFDAGRVESFLNAENTPPHPDFDFVYTGTMFLGRGRAAAAFLEAVRTVPDVRVAMMGQWPDWLPLRFQDLITRGRLVLFERGAPEAAWRLVLRSRIGLSFATSAAPCSIATKIYEYPALGRPVASLAYGGAADQLVQRAGLGFVIDAEALNSTECMASEIHRMLAAAQEWKQPDMTPFTREYAARAVHNLLQEVVDGG